MRAEFESPGGRGRGRGRGSPVKGRGRGRGRGRSEIDKSSLECYRCHKLGHFAYECTNEDKDVNYVEFDEDEDLVLMAHAEVKNEEKSGIWLLNSACSNHMTGDKDWFINLDEGFKHSVILGNDLRLKVKGIGDIRFGVEGVTQVISRVYYIPELTSNLLSVGQLQEKDLTIIIKKGMCKVYHPQHGMIAYSKMTKNRMFVVKATMKPLGTKCLKVKDDDNEQIWHRRLGHVNNKCLRTMQF
nr:retrovirus-related Pol polyprotein from transposon TNT 1-94 [Tanacetum cinerariifolium]